MCNGAGSPSLQVGGPVGSTALVGGCPRERRRLRGRFGPWGSARRRCCPLGGHPYGGVLPVGAVAAGAAALWCLTPREKRPQAPLPHSAFARGSNTR
ncbi:hypothetical protein C4D60_Mb00t00930 [Musa balbisiana]|uniref:Uncharacterized protein n=1 Tax=Musa balbisiana TaxID=52838 RepID=A0A4S8I6R6_MUSBA|nr:hypothetical protein C4D60_Mb00t00930 [Musa balbisiana]